MTVAKLRNFCAEKVDIAGFGNAIYRGALRGQVTFAKAYAAALLGGPVLDVPVKFEEADSQGRITKFEHSRCNITSSGIERVTCVESSNNDQFVDFGGGYKRAFVFSAVADLASSGGGGSTDAVLYTPQTLTEKLQIQAAANISAVRAPALAAEQFALAAEQSARIAADALLSDDVATRATQAALNGEIFNRVNADNVLAAEITGLAAVATSGAYSDISGRPLLGTAAALDVPASGDASAVQVVKGNDSRLLGGGGSTPSGPQNSVQRKVGAALVGSAGMTYDGSKLAISSGTDAPLQVSRTDSASIPTYDQISYKLAEFISDGSFNLSRNRFDVAIIDQWTLGITSTLPGATPVSLSLGWYFGQPLAVFNGLGISTTKSLVFETAGIVFEQNANAVLVSWPAGKSIRLQDGATGFTTIFGPNNFSIIKDFSNVELMRATIAGLSYGGLPAVADRTINYRALDGGSGALTIKNGAVVSSTTSTASGICTARIYRNTDQAIPSGAAYTDLEFSTAAYEEGGVFWTSGATITIPATGYYQVFVEATMTGAGLLTAATASLQVLHNGANVIAEDERTVAINGKPSLLCMAQRRFTAGETLKVQIKHSEPGPLSVIAQGDHSPDIILTRVG